MPMRSIFKKLLLTICFVLCITGICIAGFRVVGESRGLYYSVLWDRWFEVPL
jgi:hypothetical protein